MPPWWGCIVRESNFCKESRIFVAEKNFLIIFHDVQWRAIQTALLPVYDVKWGHFEREKMTLKMLPASWYLKYLFKRFRSFNTVNMGSFGQRASKLLAVKVGGLKKKSAIWPRPLSNQSARVWLRPRSNLSQSLTDSNFAALWPTDPIFLSLKDLNPL